MAKKAKPEGKKYSYMDTYGDLVTLLLCFFVLLFSMSTIEEQKYNAFVEALSGRFGSVPTNSTFVSPDESVPVGSEIGNVQQTGDTTDPDITLPQDFTQLNDAITKFIEENNLQSEVSVQQNKDNSALFIRMSNNMLFAGNASNLKPEVHVFLDFIRGCLNNVQEQVMQVKFNGHTASVPGSTVDDWILSGERATKVASYVYGDGLFNRFKMQAIGYGRNYPITDNETEDGRAKNRRVDIIILSNNVTQLETSLTDAMRVYFPGDDMQHFQGDAKDLAEDMIDGITPVDKGSALSGLTSEQIAQLMEQAESMAGTSENAASTGTPEQDKSGSG